MRPNQAFLDSLKPGDKFVLRNRRLDTFGRKMGPAIFEVVKIPPKRSKFVVKAADGKEFEIKGHGTLIEGGGFSRDYFEMEAYTPAIDQEIVRNTDFIKSKNRAYELEELVRLYARQEDLTPAEVEAFLTASLDLRNLLRKRFPKTEV